MFPVELIAQALPAATPAPDMGGLAYLLTSLGAGGFSIWIAWYLITKAMPRQTDKMTAAIEAVVNHCREEAERKDERHEKIIGDLATTFRDEAKESRAAHQAEQLATRNHAHAAHNLMQQQSLQTTEILSDMSKVMGAVASKFDVALIKKSEGPKR